MSAGKKKLAEILFNKHCMKPVYQFWGELASLLCCVFPVSIYLDLNDFLNQHCVVFYLDFVVLDIF